MIRKTRWAALCAGVLLGSSALAAIDEVRYFEENSLAGFNISGNAPTTQSQVKRGGKYGMKTVLSYTGNNNYRTEVRLKATPPEHKKEYWYGFSIYLPADYAPDKVWEIVAQWHHTPDAGDTIGNPPLALETTNGIWKLQSKSNKNRKTTNSGTVSAGFNLGPYSTGRWTDWVFRIVWSYESGAGVLEVWKDGKKVLSRNGPNTYNDARMPYFKKGIYKGWRSNSPDKVRMRTLYHDQFRMVGPGGSYSLVAPTASSSISPAKL